MTEPLIYSSVILALKSNLHGSRGFLLKEPRRQQINRKFTFQSRETIVDVAINFGVTELEKTTIFNGNSSLRE